MQISVLQFSRSQIQFFAVNLRHATIESLISLKLQVDTRARACGKFTEYIGRNQQFGVWSVVLQSSSHHQQVNVNEEIMTA
jgi:hypothetical protein